MFPTFFSSFILPSLLSELFIHSIDYTVYMISLVELKHILFVTCFQYTHTQFD